MKKKSEREREEYWYKGVKMPMNKYLSIITLNVNGLNALVKRLWVAEWIRKHDPHIWCLQETYFNKKSYTDCR